MVNLLELGAVLGRLHVFFRYFSASRCSFAVISSADPACNVNNRKDLYESNFKWYAFHAWLTLDDIFLLLVIVYCTYKPLRFISLSFETSVTYSASPLHKKVHLKRVGLGWQGEGKLFHRYKIS